MSVARRPEDKRFTSAELRRRAESAFGRALSSDQWAIVDPDGSYQLVTGEYDATDLDDLLAAMRKQLPAPETLSAASQQAIDHAAMVAKRLFREVQRHRLQLFGSSDPPCVTIDDAGRWIEGRQRPPTTILVEVAIDLPLSTLTDAFGPAPLLAVRDWLNERFPPATAMRRKTNVSAGTNEPLPQRTLGYRMLPYYRPRDETIGDAVLSALPETAQRTDAQPLIVECVPVDADSDLGRLLAAAEDLGRQTSWPVEWAVVHLLTGLRLSTPLRTESFITGLERAPAVRIEVLEPEAVTKEMVSAAYDEARRQLPAVPFSRRSGKPARQRARTRAQPAELLPFVEQHRDHSWPERQLLWNKTHPSEQLSSHEAMRKRFERAADKQRPDA